MLQMQGFYVCLGLSPNIMQEIWWCKNRLRSVLSKIRRSSEKLLQMAKHPLYNSRPITLAVKVTSVIPSRCLVLIHPSAIVSWMDFFLLSFTHLFFFKNN
jgi:hypothetical protein